jgi:hypothetical protein
MRFCVAFQEMEAVCVREPEAFELHLGSCYDYLCDDGVWRVALLTAECKNRLWLRFAGWSVSRRAVVPRDLSRFAKVTHLPIICFAV